MWGASPIAQTSRNTELVHLLPFFFLLKMVCDETTEKRQKRLAETVMQSLEARWPCTVRPLLQRWQQKPHPSDQLKMSTKSPRSRYWPQSRGETAQLRHCSPSVSLAGFTSLGSDLEAEVINPLCRQAVPHVAWNTEPGCCAALLGAEDLRGEAHVLFLEPSLPTGLHHALLWMSPGRHWQRTRNKELHHRAELGTVVIPAPFSPLLPAEHFYVFDPFILALPFFVPWMTGIIHLIIYYLVIGHKFYKLLRVRKINTF